MKLNLVSSQSNGNLEEYITTHRKRKMTNGWRKNLEDTIQLIKFIKTEVNAPPHRFAISHMSWLFIIEHNYFGSKLDIKLTVSAHNGIYYLSYWTSLENEVKMSTQHGYEAKLFIEKRLNGST